MDKKELEKLVERAYNGPAASAMKRLRQALNMAYDKGHTDGWNGAVKEYVTG